MSAAGRVADERSLDTTGTHRFRQNRHQRGKFIRDGRFGSITPRQVAHLVAQSRQRAANPVSLRREGLQDQIELGDD